MELPGFVTHYYEAEYGPFLNICDADSETIEALVGKEKDAVTAFNRFALGPDFFACRKAADDLLLDLYTTKFSVPPPGRPYYCVLGAFEKTLTMYRYGKSIELPIRDFQEGQLTFMYPDHFHLVSLFDSAAPRYGYQLPEDWRKQDFWGKLFTFQELEQRWIELGICERIESWRKRNGWVGAYVEGQIWDRSLRERFLASQEDAPGRT